MALRKDKQKVVGEVIDEAKVRSFLAYEPYDDVSKDFHILTKAYRGLPPEGFERFVEIFVEEGHDINAKDEHGVSFLDRIRRFKRHPEYVAILENAGAR